MKFVSEPSISVKIRKMKERVRWGDPAIVDREIDQTRMVFKDDGAENSQFSFLVVGDSGSGFHRGQNPQRQIAEQMATHRDSCRFVLHTGDVVYLVGSSEYYHENFIQPYREFLVGGEQPEKIAYDRMVFKLPILPVPGNHDYYDLPIFARLLSGITSPIRRLLPLDLDIGWHGSFQGQAYARAFLDYLQGINNSEELGRYLDQHYTAKTETGRCLFYQPGTFTRLPNRYYTFNYGGIDFFALDSNTFNDPLPLPDTGEGQAYRRELELRRAELERQEMEIIRNSATLNPNSPEEAEQIHDLRTTLEQIEELKIDINKQLASDQKTVVDYEQLDWLQQKLIQSWCNPQVRGRIIYLHHPPYVTEATKWEQAQTLAVRHRLRAVFDAVANEVGSVAKDRPLVDLILTGHAHCLEYLRTEDTGHADSYLNWIVCGGSGFSLRRQRLEGSDLMESFGAGQDRQERLVARSHLFLGRTGHGTQKHKPYSFLRIDVQDGCPPKFIVRPFITERFQQQWDNREIAPLTI